MFCFICVVKQKRRDKILIETKQIPPNILIDEL